MFEDTSCVRNSHLWQRAKLWCIMTHLCEGGICIAECRMQVLDDKVSCQARMAADRVARPLLLTAPSIPKFLATPLSMAAVGAHSLLLPHTMRLGGMWSPMTGPLRVPQ